MRQQRDGWNRKTKVLTIRPVGSSCGLRKLLARSDVPENGLLKSRIVLRKTTAFRRKAHRMSVRTQSLGSSGKQRVMDNTKLRKSSNHIVDIVLLCSRFYFIHHLHSQDNGIKCERPAEILAGTAHIGIGLDTYLLERTSDVNLNGLECFDWLGAVPILYFNFRHAPDVSALNIGDNQISARYQRKISTPLDLINTYFNPLHIMTCTINPQVQNRDKDVFSGGGCCATTIYFCTLFKINTWFKKKKQGWVKHLTRMFMSRWIRFIFH